ncbi:MAG: hypothetical protein ACYTF7_01955 [Planctomycetota bacterium]|jgi:hypothetical protein
MGLRYPFGAVFVALMVCLVGCASTGERVRPDAPPDRIEAEWDDLDAAMSHTVGEHEWAVLVSTDVSEGVREYELVSLTDQPGMVRFTRSDAEPSVLVEVRLGRFGNPERERVFRWTLVERLEWLRERD